MNQHKTRPILRRGHRVIIVIVIKGLLITRNTARRRQQPGRRDVCHATLLRAHHIEMCSRSTRAAAFILPVARVFDCPRDRRRRI